MCYFIREVIIINTLKFKRLREAKGLMQMQLAKDLDVHPSTISGYEQGIREPDNEMIKRIANYFNVTIDYLLDNENNIDKSDYELREKINFVNFLIRKGFIKKNDKFTDEDIDNLIEFIKSNKKYIYNEKSNKK